MVFGSTSQKSDCLNGNRLRLFLPFAMFPVYHKIHYDSIMCNCREAFFNRVPFPVIHIDNGIDFPETYQLRDELAKKWDLKVLVAKSVIKTDKISGISCCGANKSALFALKCPSRIFIRRVPEHPGSESRIVSRFNLRTNHVGIIIGA